MKFSLGEGLGGFKKDAAAAGFYKHFNSVEFVAMLLLANDILPLLAALSTLFQSEDCDFCQLETAIPIILNDLEMWKTQPGNSYKQLTEFRQQLTVWGHATSVGRFSLAQVRQMRIRWLTDLQDNLRARFPDVPTLAAFSRLFHTKHWPTELNSRELQEYGAEPLELIMTQLYGLYDDRSKRKVNGIELTKEVSTCVTIML